YLELQRGSTLVTGMQICTANDFAGRDPFKMSLEGSNQSGTNLILGTSWTLIYHGTTGLQADPGRFNCGTVRTINNTAWYSSYRFLVSDTRENLNTVQYSEVRLYGY
ncbi:unnamed protein product, partial [Adineta ricciae]